jgi:hypothetical protein
MVTRTNLGLGAALSEGWHGDAHELQPGCRGVKSRCSHVPNPSIPATQKKGSRSNHKVTRACIKNASKDTGADSSARIKLCHCLTPFTFKKLRQKLHCMVISITQSSLGIPSSPLSTGKCT